MKKTACTPRRFIAALVLLTVLPLSSCLRLPFHKGQASPSEQAPAASSALPSPAAVSPEVPSPEPTDWHSGVKTDYSGLTPFKPPEEKYTRLSDGPMPALTPSDSYGRLLPYAGEALFADSGYNSFNLYGLVTDDARIVTDPVYTRVYQAGYYDYANYTYKGVPAYDLEKLTDAIDKENPWNSIRHAAAALDGSWVTPFDYTGVNCTDTVIICIRDYNTNDVDVLDYSGRLLYNSKTLGCYNDLPPQSSYAFQGGYGEGLIALPLSSGKTVYIDAITGAETMTDYVQGEAFFNGFARVHAKDGGLVGFINKNFELVIKPQFLFADYFIGGQSVAQYEDGAYAVIDVTGAVLFKNTYMISRYDKDTYGVADVNNNTRYYDTAFKEIASDGGQLTPLYDGWFYYTTNRGCVLMKNGEKYTLDGVKQPGAVTNGLVSYYDSGKDSWSEGVKTLDGKTVVPLTENASSNIVADKATGDVYIIVSYYGKDAASQTFTILTADGETVLSGEGYAIFDENNNLFQVNGTQSFGYADTDGNYIFRISLLDDVPD
jgi:hypothetical protein